MAIKFSEEEQFLIDEMEKHIKNLYDNSALNIDASRLSDVLMKNIGNMDFNKKLRSYQKTIDSKESRDVYYSLEWLKDFTYATRDYDLVKQVLPKAEAILTLDEKGKKIENFEKLSLKEYGQIERFQKLYYNEEYYGEALKYISENSSNKEFKKLFSNSEKTKDILNKLEEKSLQSDNYKSGDLVMNLTSKTSAVKGRSKLMGHEGKLEEKFVTKYNHAAPIFVKENKPILSHIINDQETKELGTKKIADADIFRIDPVKLVHKNMIPNLEKVDYGNKKNGEKITWQEAIKERYESFSFALHEGLAPSQIENFQSQIQICEQKKQGKEKKIKSVDKNLKKINKELKQTNREFKKVEKEFKRIEKESKINKTQTEKMNDIVNYSFKTIEDVSNLDSVLKEKDILALETAKIERKKEINRQQKEKETSKIKSLKSKIRSLKSEKRSLENDNKDLENKVKNFKEKIESLKEKIIKNDNERYSNSLNWVGPKSLVQGHSKWLSKNQYDDISKKMFDANPDEKEMICSEFAARCIASTVDQLNKNIQLDLEAAGLDGKKEVIKNPIPKKERLDKIHPERLVNILKKSGSVEKVENPGLNNIIDTENLGKKQTKDLSEILVKKTLTVLANSETKEAFVDDMAVNLSAYLKAQGVKPENLEQTKQNVINQELGVLYESYKKKPEGIFKKVESFCLKVLESCKLRTKNKKAMKDIVGLMSSVNDIKEDLKVKNLSSASKEGKRIPKKKTKTSSFSR